MAQAVRTLASKLVSKRHYRGINFFLLSLAGYGSQYLPHFASMCGVVVDTVRDIPDLRLVERDLTSKQVLLSEN